jgi:hypothetical protein
MAFALATILPFRNWFWLILVGFRLLTFVVTRGDRGSARRRHFTSKDVTNQQFSQGVSRADGERYVNRILSHGGR